MKVVNVSQVPKVPLVNPLFTSSDVSVQPLAPAGGTYNANVVTFGKGVRNKFHAHESDQVLIVTAGRGIVATEDEEREVTTGDVIFFAAGEKHWHGATADSEFSHIYVHLADARTSQLEE